MNIPSTSNDGKYKYFSGTSFATAYFTGILSLILNETELRTKESIEEYMKSFTYDLGKKGHDPEYGIGAIKFKGKKDTK